MPCGIGLGAGASGASAGLLHPYTPRGKLLWRGEECMKAALDLVAVAAAAVQPHAAMERDDSPAGAATEPPVEQFVWRQPIMRPAVTAKQVCYHVDAKLRVGASDSASHLDQDPAGPWQTAWGKLSWCLTIGPVRYNQLIYIRACRVCTRVSLG